MRVLTLYCIGAPSTRAWTVDRDCLLMGAQNTAGNAVISGDPAVTAAAFATPSVESKLWDYYIWLSSGSATSTFPVRNLKIPLLEGMSLFVAVSSTSAVMLYLDEVSPEITAT